MNTSLENKPHIHSEIIKCWADGAVIQYYDEDHLMWIDCRNNHPTWNVSVKYRVIPSRLKLVVHVAEMSTSMFNDVTIVLKGSIGSRILCGGDIAKLELELDGNKIVSAKVV